MGGRGCCKPISKFVLLQNIGRLIRMQHFNWNCSHLHSFNHTRVQYDWFCLPILLLCLCVYSLPRHEPWAGGLERVRRAAEELSYADTKPEQQAVLINCVKSRDIFAILPSVFRKSMCYAGLPCTFGKIVNRECGYCNYSRCDSSFTIVKNQVS